MGIWLVPINETFRQTLESPVDLTRWVGRTIDFPLFARVLGVRTGSRNGARKRTKQYWESMETGDPVLAYWTNRDRYTAFGRVGLKAETRHFLETYWDDEAAVSVFTIDDYDDSLDLDPEAVNDVLGYAEDFRPHGLSKVSSDRPISELLFFLDVNREQVEQ